MAGGTNTNDNGRHNIRMPEHAHQIRAVATSAGYIRAGERQLQQQKKEAMTAKK